MRKSPPCAPVADRFLEKVCRTPDENGCLIWQGYVHKLGYGIFHLTKDLVYRKVYAHRMAWVLANGEIPATIDGRRAVIRHKCDVQLCMNTEHLELGTQRENMKDASERNRLNLAPSRAALSKKYKWTEDYCRNGHLRTEDNLDHYIYKGKVRVKCRECRRELKRKKI
jgi:HNH endonuclease